MITNKKFLCSLSTELNFEYFSENFSLLDLLFFDIETTGLSPKTSHVYLIGLIQYNPDASCFEMTQYLAESEEPSEEIQVLESFCRVALTKNCLVHFNGGSFDLPFLKHRCKALHLTESLSQFPSLDLYRELLSMPAFFRQMPDHKQKSFELLIGYPREDRLSGKEMITAFQEYAKTKDSSTLNLLFLHNEDDLKGMLALTSLGSLKQLLNGSCQITDVQELQEPNLDGAMETKLLFSLSLETPVPVTLSANAEFCYITVTENKAKIKCHSMRAPSCIFIQTIKIITTCHLKMKQFTKALPLTWNLPTGKKPQPQPVTKKSAVNSSMHLVHRICRF